MDRIYFADEEPDDPDEDYEYLQSQAENAESESGYN